MGISCFLFGHKRGYQVQKFNCDDQDHSGDEDFVYVVRVYQCAKCEKHLLSEGWEFRGGVSEFLKRGLPEHLHKYVNTSVSR